MKFLNFCGVVFVVLIYQLLFVNGRIFFSQKLLDKVHEINQQNTLDSTEIELGAPQNCTVAELSSRFITLEWKGIPQIIPDLQYLILWTERRPSENGTESNSRQVTTIINATADKQYEFPVTDLKPYKRYQFMIVPFLENQIGIGVEFGKPCGLVITTDEEVPGPPKNLSIDAVGPTYCLVSWEYPDPEERHGKITKFEIRVNGSNFLYEGIVELDTDVMLKALQPQNEYVFEVRAYTSKGAGAWTEPIIGRTTPPRSSSIDDRAIAVWEPVTGTLCVFFIISAIVLIVLNRDKVMTVYCKLRNKERLFDQPSIQDEDQNDYIAVAEEYIEGRLQRWSKPSFSKDETQVKEKISTDHIYDSIVEDSTEVKQETETPEEPTSPIPIIVETDCSNENIVSSPSTSSVTGTTL